MPYPQVRQTHPSAPRGGFMGVHGGQAHPHPQTPSPRRQTVKVTSRPDSHHQGGAPPTGGGSVEGRPPIAVTAPRSLATVPLSVYKKAVRERIGFALAAARLPALERQMRQTVTQRNDL